MVNKKKFNLLLVGLLLIVSINYVFAEESNISINASFIPESNFSLNESVNESTEENLINQTTNETVSDNITVDINQTAENITDIFNESVANETVIFNDTISLNETASDNGTVYFNESLLKNQTIEINESNNSLFLTIMNNIFFKIMALANSASYKLDMFLFGIHAIQSDYEGNYVLMFTSFSDGKTGDASSLSYTANIGPIGQFTGYEACEMQTCSQFGYNCDILEDSCGGYLHCGTCASNYECVVGVCTLEEEEDDGGSPSNGGRKSRTEDEVNASDNETSVPAETVTDALPEELFDITFNLEDNLIEDINELTGVIIFESFGTVPTLVNLKFTIFDEWGNNIYNEEENITVTTEEVLRWNYEGPELDDGKYVAILKTLYNTDVYDEFRQDFEIKKKVGIATYLKKNWRLGTFIVIVLALIIAIVFWIIKKRESQRFDKIKTSINQDTGKKEKNQIKEKIVSSGKKVVKLRDELDRITDKIKKRKQ